MIKIIAAVSENMVIGLNNELPWGGSYPEDLKHFKEMTSGCPIIMGRKTFQSLPKRLPNRRHIVISSSAIFDKSSLLTSEDKVVNSMEEALSEAGKHNETIWIIGGAMVYEEGLKHADEIHLVRIPETIFVRIPETIFAGALVKFPKIDSLKFKLNMTSTLSYKLTKEIYVKI